MWEQVSNKQSWNDLVGLQEHSCFLQSWEWGEFQEIWNRKVLRFSWNNQILAQAIKMPLALGKYYWYIPHAPVIVSKTKDAFISINTLADDLAKQGALFLRIDPIVSMNLPAAQQEQDQITKPLKFVPATQAQCTRILYINKTKEALLASMHQKTRYNIRLAQKKGVEVRKGSISEFLTLSHQTTARDKFTQNSDQWLRSMAEKLSNISDATLKIWIAYYNQIPVAGSITTYFGDTVTYLHGASANEHRDVMAPHSLHWEIIKNAQQGGFKYYDFRGVNPKDENHVAYKNSWVGISRFKQGFGGKLVCYPNSFDLIFKRSWYTVYTIFKRLKGLL